MPEWLEFWHTPPDAKRHSLSKIVGPLPDAEAGVLSEKCGNVKESRGSWHAKLRESEASPLAKEEDSETTDENGPLLVPRSALYCTGRQHHRLRMLDDHWMCRDGVGRSAPGTKSCENTGSTTELSSRSWDAPQICNGARAPSGRMTSKCSVQEVQHHHGSQLLAAVMDRWPSFSRFGRENFSGSMDV